ncbi:uncharacterized protein LOC131244039 [Magnolia sinica]|uniref:uncharacterized protein LOC131244039 n=1 Tax=Magnolia sinica TaxID=86752 RepID=UPI00265AD5AB|nr:uncharacterized protein LOC131244039 [Magnolia sinica]
MTDVEIAELLQLLDLLNSASPSNQEEDFMIWSSHSSSRFFVRFFSVLSRGLPPPTHSFLHWFYGALPRVVVFVWLVARKRVLTIDNLERRSLALPKICLMCMESAESIDHLFIHCSFARKVWRYFLRSSNMPGVMLASMESLLWAWHWRSGRKDAKAKWRDLRMAILWVIRRERNGWCFRNEPSSAERVVGIINGYVFDWVSVV